MFIFYLVLGAFVKLLPHLVLLSGQEDLELLVVSSVVLEIILVVLGKTLHPVKAVKHLLFLAGSIRLQRGFQNLLGLFW